MPDNESPHEALRAAEPTPIAQLNPDLSDQKTRAVDGAVTVTWPFSIVTKSIAFIVAERDFRLRREKGQVRIQFHGAAARAIADASVGGGDEIRLSLDGVRWEANASNTQLAGSTLGWQLEYTSRLLLIIKGTDSQDEKVINVDVSDMEAETTDDADAPTSLDESNNTSNLAIPSMDLSDAFPSKKRPSSSFETQEFASPAFIKRARVSYGSLFEGGLDIFDEEASQKSKTKKKSRFSLPATAWRYSSRSPTPEVEPEPEPEPEPVESSKPNGINTETNKDTCTDDATQAPEDVPMDTPPRPVMVDEGCQTVEVDFTPMSSVQVSAETRSAFAFSYATPTPIPRTKLIHAEDTVLDHSLQLQACPTDAQSSVNDIPTGFLGQSPHGDNGLAFGFANAQPLMYPAPPGLFPAPRSEESLHESIPDVSVSENYPASFLDNSTLQTTIDTHPSLSSRDSPGDLHPSEQTVAPFQGDSQFYSPYHTTPQPQPNSWTTVQSAPLSTVDDSNDVENPVEIISSSPRREQDVSEDIPSSPSERTGLTSIPPHFRRQQYTMHETQNTILEEDEVATEQEASVADVGEDDEYQDAGDEPGDDYDLRNYDRAHDDDDDVDASEEEQEPNTQDPDAQVFNPEEDEDDEDDEEEEEVEMEEGDEDDEGEEEEEDDEEEDDEDEEEEDEEGEEDDEEEEEEQQELARPQAPRPPIFIDLLSDSDDEDEAAPEPVKLEQPQEPDETSQPDEASEELIGSEELAAAPDTTEELPMEEDPKSPVSEPQNDSPKATQDGPSEAATPEEEKPELPEQMEIDNEPSIVPTSRSSERDQNEIAQPTPVEEHEPSATHAKTPDGEVETANETAVEAEHEIQKITMTEQLDVVPTTEALGKVPEAVEIDGPGSTDVTKLDDLAATAEKSVIDTMEIVDGKESGNSITEDAHSANGDQEDVAEAPISAPLANDAHVDSSTMSDAPAQETETVQEDLKSTKEGQGQGQAESNDATMQDISHVETTNSPRSWQAINVPEIGDGEGDEGEGAEEANKAPKLATGQVSPPATQTSHSQVLQETSEPTFSQATSTNLEHNNLPTPRDTQTEDVEMAENYHLTEDDLSPEDQIMAEIQQHSPIKSGTWSAHAHPVASSSAASPQLQSELAETSGELESTGTVQASDALITVKSLRSRGHRSTKSKSSDISLAEPGPSLAKPPTSPTQADDDVKAKGPQATLRITRSKSDQVDPSIKLARATTGSGGVKGKGRERDVTDEAENSPPAKLRVSRTRADHIDPSIQLAKGPASSTRQSRRLVTPEMKQDVGTGSRGPTQNANTPDTAVSAPLKSPSVAGSSAAPEDENVGTVKLHLLKSLRTGLPDCTSLKMLRNSLHQSTDIIAVATATPAQPHRPKHGPRDYMLTLNLTDPSVAPTGVSVAHIFRPHQASLPVVHAGDVVLLRRVQVVAMKGRGFGVRAGDASAWAVFEKGDEELLPQIKGPPVEVAEKEGRYVEGLRRWWGLLDDKAMEKMERASRKVSDAGKEDVK